LAQRVRELDYSYRAFLTGDAERASCWSASAGPHRGAQERQDSGSPIPSSNPVARRSDPVSPHRPECPCAGHMMRKGQTAAHALGLPILVLETGSDPDYDATFENLVQRRVGPLIVGTAAFFLHRGDRLALMAARQAITARGLMSYGTRITDAIARLASTRPASSKVPSRPICRLAASKAFSRPPKRCQKRAICGMQP
jgi:hypothetical protein